MVDVCLRKSINRIELKQQKSNQMPIPDFQSIMLPLLQSCADGQEHGLRETIETLATTFQLTEEERQELLPSGSQAIFDNRVGWSKPHWR
jgi:restriction system protein